MCDISINNNASRDSALRPLYFDSQTGKVYAGLGLPRKTHVITESCALPVPEGTTGIEIHLIGGGANASYDATTYHSALGGAGGEAHVYLSATDITSNTLDVTIGAGGHGGFVRFEDVKTTSIPGQTGGTTEVRMGGTVVASALGGSAVGPLSKGGTATIGDGFTGYVTEGLPGLFVSLSYDLGGKSSIGTPGGSHTNINRKAQDPVNPGQTHTLLEVAMDATYGSGGGRDLTKTTGRTYTDGADGVVIVTFF